jgi:hypothetical protein
VQVAIVSSPVLRHRSYCQTGHGTPAACREAFRLALHAQRRSEMRSDARSVLSGEEVKNPCPTDALPLSFFSAFI